MSLESLPSLHDGLTRIQRQLLEALARMSGRDGRRSVGSNRVLESVLGGPVPHLEESLAAGRGEPPEAVGRDPAEPYRAAYLELVHLAQPFRTRYPLVVGSGNFGTMDGDPPAEPAFTRCRLSGFGADVLAGIAPHLLVNGAVSGPLDACVVRFLPHNLGEVVEAASALIREPELSDDELVSKIPGPDFPTGGEVVTPRPVLAEIYREAEGRLTVRASARFETSGTRTAIVVDELPFCMSKGGVMTRCSELLGSGAREDAVDLLDESDADRVRLVLPLRPGADPELTMSQIRRWAGLETDLEIVSEGVVDGSTRRVSLAELLRAFVRRFTDALGKGGETVDSAEHLARLRDLKQAYADLRRTALA